MKTYQFCYNIVAFIIISITFLEPCLAVNTKINGLVINKSISEIRIGIYVNPIQVIPANYTKKVANGQFNIQFDLTKPAYGFIDFGGFFYNIFILPGKNILFKLDQDKIVYTGNTAYENNFLYQIKGDQQWHYNDYNLKLTPDSVYNQMRLKQQKLYDYLTKFSKNHKLPDAFVVFFKAEDACRFNKFLIDFSLEYAAVNHVFLKNRLYNYSFDYFAKDNYLHCPTYINNLQKLINKGKEISTLVRVKNISFDEARSIILTDSLKGKTRDYIIANRIYFDFVLANKVDSALINMFKRIGKDTLATIIVNKIIRDYTFTFELKNKPLPHHLNSTKLIDTHGNEISLGNLLALHRGKVIYLDVWSYYCPPCRAEVPYAKILKKEYKTKPISFINIHTDMGLELKKSWNEYFKVSGTKDNHYRFKKGFNAELLQKLAIKSNPHYILLDKQGKLIQRNAPRPSEKELLKPLLNTLLSTN